jgi:uncharacterized SAM-binding protein YcdF (DUF218 family)
LEPSGRGDRRARSFAVGLAVGGAAGLLADQLSLASIVSYGGPRPPLVVAAAVGGGLLWGTRLRPVVLAGTGTLAVLWLAVAFTPFVAWLGEGLVRRDPPGAADAVFVSASNLQLDGEPTANAQARLLRGLELVGEGRTTRIVLAELRPPKPSYVPVARTEMERLGLRAEILTVGPVVNTHDEAVAVAALARARGWTRILLATSPTHSRRAAATLEHEGLAVLSSPAVEVHFDLENLDRWETVNERFQGFSSIAHERLGLVVYRRRGWIR